MFRFVQWLLLGIILTALGGGWALMIRMPGKSYRGPFAPLAAEEIKLRGQLHHDVEQLGGRIGERNFAHFQQLEAAADFIDQTLTSAGYLVTRHTYSGIDHTSGNLHGYGPYPVAVLFNQNNFPLRRHGDYIYPIGRLNNIKIMLLTRKRRQGGILSCGKYSIRVYFP